MYGGHNKQYSVYGKTQKEAKDKLRIKIYEISCGEIIQENKMTTSEWCDIWLQEYTNDIKPLTLASYKGIVKNHIVPLVGNIRLQELTSVHIQKAYNALNQNNISAKTIQNIHGVMHRLLEQAIKIGYIRTNVSNACVLPKPNRAKINLLNEEQIGRLLAGLSDDVYSDVFFVTLFTGMRQGEVLGLTWDNIDFDNNILIIDKQLLKDVNKSTGEQFCFAPTKNSKSREIAVPECVMNIFRKRLKIRQTRMAILDEFDKKWSNLVFTQNNGKHLIHGTVREKYKDFVTKLGIPNSRFHDLRHSYAMISLQNGDDIKTIQDNMGHHCSAFTLQTYAYSTKKMKKVCANRMDEFVSSIGKKE